jgi:hypothetical protein
MAGLVSYDDFFTPDINMAYLDKKRNKRKIDSIK